jgi:predicted RNA-binding protein YlqC (UPF0109 family)
VSPENLGVDTADLQQLLDALTRGPWQARVASNSRNGGQVIELRGRDGRVIATIRSILAIAPLEEEANVRLLALAPDLLAEVIRLRSELEWAYGQADAAASAHMAAYRAAASGRAP